MIKLLIPLHDSRRAAPVVEHHRWVVVPSFPHAAALAGWRLLSACHSHIFAGGRSPMLHWFRNRGLRRAAMIIAALYAFCVSAPSAALALNNAIAANCLTELQVRVPAASRHSHTHADGTVHQHHQHHDDGAAAHHSNNDGRSPPASCCAAFFISGLAADAGIVLAVRSPIHPDFPALDDHLSGRTPERINRPPIA